jgi:hypothetical protein
MNKHKIKGFTLIKEYPDCRYHIGHFEAYTTGYYLDFPEFWQPVYEKGALVVFTGGGIPIYRFELGKVYKVTETNQHGLVEIGDHAMWYANNLYRPAMESEIDEYNKNNQKFKANDWVVFEELPPHVLSFKKGGIYQISKDSDLRTLNFKKDESGSSNGWSYANWSEFLKLRLVTPEEIKSKLISDAQKAGFIIGAKAKDGESTIIIESFKLIGSLCDASSNITSDFFKENGTHLAVSGNGFLIPVEQLTLLPSNPSITINSHKAEFHEWGVSFNNCAKIHKTTFIKLAEAVRMSSSLIHEISYHNRSIDLVKIGQGEFTRDQIYEIADYYLSEEKKR